MSLSGVAASSDPFSICVYYTRVSLTFDIRTYISSPSPFFNQPMITLKIINVGFCIALRTELSLVLFL